MLQYVFWHQPAAGVDAERYEAALSAFHEAVRGAPPRGFVRSRAYRVENASWLPGEAGYEDWYEVVDFTSLGLLNDAAVAARLRPVHHEAASLAGFGTAGLYQDIRTASPELPALTACLWLTKPREQTYESFWVEVEQQFGSTVHVSQRQMTLGPAPEVCVAGSRSLASALVPSAWDARFTRREQIWPRGES
jgi:hypothetical protein